MLEGLVSKYAERGKPLPSSLQALVGPANETCLELSSRQWERLMYDARKDLRDHVPNEEKELMPSDCLLVVFCLYILWIVT